MDSLHMITLLGDHLCICIVHTFDCIYSPMTFGDLTLIGVSQEQEWNMVMCIISYLSDSGNGLVVGRTVGCDHLGAYDKQT